MTGIFARLDHLFHIVFPRCFGFFAFELPVTKLEAAIALYGHAMMKDPHSLALDW
jgi:hypothetical protein